MKHLLPQAHYIDSWLDQINAHTMNRHTHAARYKNLLHALKDPKELAHSIMSEWPEEITPVKLKRSPIHFSAHSFAAAVEDANTINPSLLSDCVNSEQTPSLVQSLIEAIVQETRVIYFGRSEHHTVSLQALINTNALCQKLIVIVDCNAVVTILDDRYYDQAQAVIGIEIHVKDNARLTWLSTANQKKINTLLMRTQCILYTNAHMQYSSATRLAQNTYHEWYVDLAGQASTIQFAGVYVLTNTQHATLRTYQYHNAPNTQSIVRVKSLLNDAVYCDYAGMITIAHTAPGANAHQENKNMLFSSDAIARSEPSLQVLTNDVQCSHGSATGYFDQDQVLYAQARGITPERVKHMLIQAFCSDMISLFDAAQQDSFVTFVRESLLENRYHETP